MDEIYELENIHKDNLINDKEKSDYKVNDRNGIVVEHVYKSFGREKVLEDISLNIPPGSIYGVVGNNGSGKTVLMKCICGFMKADRGRIYVGGKQIGKDVDFPESIGVIIETPGFIPYMSGYKNLKILASLKALIGKEEIVDALELVGLKSFMRKHVSKYSLGMRQRLGIAQAIMEKPDILILDEPFNGLDKNKVEDMRVLLQNLKNEGKAILLASHNSKDISVLCDEVIEMSCT